MEVGLPTRHRSNPVPNRHRGQGRMGAWVQRVAGMTGVGPCLAQTSQFVLRYRS